MAAILDVKGLSAWYGQIPLLSTVSSSLPPRTPANARHHRRVPVCDTLREVCRRRGEMPEWRNGRRATQDPDHLAPPPGP